MRLPRLILIVGLQKSGTTMLLRLLHSCAQIRRVFPREGDEFWGNEPPFAPSAFPAGSIYRNYDGARGHEADADDCTVEMKHVLRARLRALAKEHRTSVVLNKCPSNAVRLPWVREVFPHAIIIGLVRHPVANVYSLSKKFVDHAERGPAPVDDWWGVKPRNWRTMLNPRDRFEQCALQWHAVNQRLLQHASLLDVLLTYRQVCEQPNDVVARIAQLAELPKLNERLRPAPPLRCFDDEYQQGGTLRTKNRLYRPGRSLLTPAPASMRSDYPPLTEQVTKRILDRAGAVARQYEAIDSQNCETRATGARGTGSTSVPPVRVIEHDSDNALSSRRQE